MAWTVQYSQRAEKQLKRLSPEIEARIRSFMDERVAKRLAPRAIAIKLTGPYEDKLRYRVGDYRVVCQIMDHMLLILVVEVAHRREVYR